MKPNTRIETRRFAGLALGLLLGAAGSQASAAGYNITLHVAPTAAGGGAANCGYNYSGAVGGVCNLQQNGVGSVSPLGGAGLATAASASGNVNGMSTGSFFVDPSIFDQINTSANLATGRIQIYGHDTAQNEFYTGGAGGTAVADMTDTLHYAIVGATASTITPIGVTFTVDGHMNPTGTDTFDNASAGEVSGGFIFGPSTDQNSASFDFQNNNTTGFATVAGLSGSVANGWTTNADHTVNTYTETYDLVGASGDFPLEAYANLFCRAGELCDYSAQIGLSGPEGFSYTSASGVFLTGGVGGVPEPATWAAMLMGFGGLGAAMRSRRRSAASAMA